MHLIKSLISLLFVCTNVFVYAQSHEGSWEGLLNVQGMKLRLVYHIEKSSGTYSGTMDSPDQGAFDLKIKAVKVDGKNMVLDMTDLGITYEGELRGKDSLVGTFKQAGQSFPLNMVRSYSSRAQLPHRPQEPTPPFPYESIEVSFTNEKAAIKLSGTLSLPSGKGPFPAVILISGSGPQNRNSEVFHHKPFLVLSDYLTRKGIAVLRYDDRGVGQSEGNFEQATSVDFAEDARAALDFLRKQKNINSKKTGIIGHSEGGMIAPLVAAEGALPAFLVLLAAPGIPIDSLMMLQSKQVARSEGINDEEIQKTLTFNRQFYDIMLNESDGKKAKSEIDKLIANYLKNLEGDKKTAAEGQLNAMYTIAYSPWFQFFIRYNPQPVLEKVKCPVLAINGDMDIQVTAKENLAGIEKSLQKGGNTNFEIREIKNLNHLMQKAEKGTISEYAALEETFSPEVLELIASWINKLK